MPTHQSQPWQDPENPTGPQRTTDHGHSTPLYATDSRNTVRPTSIRPRLVTELYMSTLTLRSPTTDFSQLDALERMSRR